jgi:HEAT repeat protein
MSKECLSLVIIDNYANGRAVCDGIKRNETSEDLPPYSDVLVDEGLTEDQCNILGNALGWGAEGEITASEVENMAQAGLPDAFIGTLAGPDGRGPIYQRVDVIRNTLFKPPTRIELDVLREIEDIGPDAFGTLPIILDEIEFLTERLHELEDKFPISYPTMETTLKANRAIQTMIASIIGMGDYGKHAIESLIDIFDDDIYNDKTHARAALALGLLKSEEALSDLNKSAWGNFLGLGISSSDAVKVQAALATFRIDANVDTAKIMPLFLSVLGKHGEGSVEAAYALGDMDSKESIQALISALTENQNYTMTNIAIREEAARSLGKLKAVEAVDFLAKVLTDEPRNIPVCKSAAWALGEIATPEVVAPLKVALRNGAAAVHDAAANALMNIDNEMAFEEIKLVMNFKGSDDARTDKIAAVDAARVLMDIGYPQAIDEIERTIQDSDVNKDVRINLHIFLDQRTKRIVEIPDKA